MILSYEISFSSSSNYKEIQSNEESLFKKYIKNMNYYFIPLTKNFQKLQRILDEKKISFHFPKISFKLLIHIQET